MRIDTAMTAPSASSAAPSSSAATTVSTSTATSCSPPPSAAALPARVTEVPRELLRNFPHTKRVGNYLLGRTLGEGSFAKVKEGLHTLTGEKVAVKVIDKRKAREDAYVRKNLRREGKLLQLVRHPHVIQLYEILETENSYYLVTELCRGGDLMDHICTRKKLDEKDTKRFIRQILLAVDYLHNSGILHRDLKVENLLLDENKNIKIIDFGLSNSVRVSHTKSGNNFSFQEFCVTQCGSPAYAAPELLGNKKYGPQVDVWSIGVNMYAMLTGSLPYTVEPFNIKALYNKMLNGEMNAIPDHLSKNCREILNRFLTSDPDKRITVQEALQHPWVAEGRDLSLEQVPFPNRLQSHQLDDRIIKHMSDNLDFRISEIIRLVTSNIPNSSTATYLLLHRKLTRYMAEQRIKGKVAHHDVRLLHRKTADDKHNHPDSHHGGAAEGGGGGGGGGGNRVTTGQVIELLPLGQTTPTHQRYSEVTPSTSHQRPTSTHHQPLPPPHQQQQHYHHQQHHQHHHQGNAQYHHPAGDHVPAPPHHQQYDYPNQEPRIIDLNLTPRKIPNRNVPSGRRLVRRHDQTATPSTRSPRHDQRPKRPLSANHPEVENYPAGGTMAGDSRDNDGIQLIPLSPQGSVRGSSGDGAGGGGGGGPRRALSARPAGRDGPESHNTTHGNNNSNNHHHDDGNHSTYELPEIPRRTPVPDEDHANNNMPRNSPTHPSRAQKQGIPTLPAKNSDKDPSSWSRSTMASVGKRGSHMQRENTEIVKPVSLPSARTGRSSRPMASGVQRRVVVDMAHYDKYARRNVRNDRSPSRKLISLDYNQQRTIKNHSPTRSPSRLKRKSSVGEGMGPHQMLAISAETGTSPSLQRRTLSRKLSYENAPPRDRRSHVGPGREQTETAEHSPLMSRDRRTPHAGANREQTDPVEHSPLLERRSFGGRGDDGGREGPTDRRSPMPVASRSNHSVSVNNKDSHVNLPAISPPLLNMQKDSQ